MYLLKAQRPGVKDALTGDLIPEEGIRREVLLPPDHYAARTGDLSIEELPPEAGAATGAEPAASETPSSSLQDVPASEVRSGRSGRATPASAS
ncbi:hypothetical protein [uncultured Variovorax sp.]|jgi:hypothetical protein|uniref:hypothetical protein n=1 Tax=uncultured Variovorax sp. TaxID=114708 RepID=UPI00260C0F23|nr:hypothetical protein [uncultured Variovorax sp.]